MSYDRKLYTKYGGHKVVPREIANIPFSLSQTAPLRPYICLVCGSGFRFFEDTQYHEIVTRRPCHAKPKPEKKRKTREEKETPGRQATPQEWQAMKRDIKQQLKKQKEKRATNRLF